MKVEIEKALFHEYFNRPPLFPLPAAAGGWKGRLYHLDTILGTALKFRGNFRSVLYLTTHFNNIHLPIAE